MCGSVSGAATGVAQDCFSGVMSGGREGLSRIGFPLDEDVWLMKGSFFVGFLLWGSVIAAGSVSMGEPFLFLIVDIDFVTSSPE